MNKTCMALWAACLGAFGSALAAEPSPAPFKPGRYELLMIGDSITDTLHGFGGKYTPLEAVWNKHYAPRQALDLGHSGIRCEGVLANFKKGEINFQESPKVAVILIGTNNADYQHFGGKRDTAEQIFAGTQAIVDFIRQRHPSTKILVLRIFPKGLHAQRGEITSPPPFSFSQEEVDTAWQAGAMTAKLADGKQVFWLDINHVFLRPDGTINIDLMPDLLHPNQAGAETWAQAIEPALATLMGDKPIVDPKPTALVPATTGGSSFNWMERHEAALAAKNVQPKIVFVGDSITHHLGGVPAPTGPYISHRGDEFWRTLCTPERPGLNLGFGGDRVQHVLWRLDHGELDGISPEHIVLTIGTNNVLSGDGTPEEIVAGIRACLQRLRAKAPKAKIILTGVPPCGNPATDPRRIRQGQVNEGLKKLAVEAKVTYLDLTPLILDANGNIPRELMDDAIHPTPAGYKIWQEALLPLLKQP